MRLHRFLKSLGPGLLYAGAAVGVSHLVQSTRAGAAYGFDLIWILILANLIKYPFFEAGPRYAIASGKSLIDGYQKLGRWAVVLYAVLTGSTMFAIQGAITIVTAGLLANVFNITINIVGICALILGVTMIILLIGKYRVLDKLIKFIIVTLALSTVIAVFFAFNIELEVNPDFMQHFQWGRAVDIAFLIAFIGWMPAPIDISVWHSLWSVAKNKELKGSTTMGEALLDFKIGYIGTAFVAMGFLTLGALVMYGTGEELSAQGTIFAGQLISLYTTSLGDALYWVIAIAALTTMFSTTITVLDAYPRVLKPSTEILFPFYHSKRHENPWLYFFWLIVLVAGTLILLGLLSGTMRFMVDLATTLSFVTAPVLAIMNYKVITGKSIPSEAKPKPWLRVYAIIGIIFLSMFTLIYIVWRVF